MKTDHTRRVSVRNSERAQVLLLFALLVVPVSLVMGLIAVDVSLWHSERRGAQKDADFTALAGAFKLLASPPAAADAIAAANAAADTNDEAGNAEIVGAPSITDDCFGGSGRLDSVAVNIRHQSRAIFGDAFGLALGPNSIGAHARACAGSVVSMTGSRPWGVESNPSCLATNSCTSSSDSHCFTPSGGQSVPIFGVPCPLDDGSLDPSTSDRGLIDLALTGTTCSDGGRDDIEANIRDGSGATCKIGDPVDPVSGARPGQDMKGLQDLLDGKGVPPVADGTDCDVKFGTDANAIDDFAEVLERIDGGPPGPSPTAVFQLRACTSPRLVHIVVLDSFAASQPRITGFAAFFILGCKKPSDPMTVLPNSCRSGPPGQLQLWGIFVNKLELDGDVGQFNPFGTNKIALVE